MEQESKEESFTITITPGVKMVVVDVYDNNDPNGMPIISEWGYNRGHAIRRTMAVILRGQGFAFETGDN
jgi:hypothetical protein